MIWIGLLFLLLLFSPMSNLVFYSSVAQLLVASTPRFKLIRSQHSKLVFASNLDLVAVKRRSQAHYVVNRPWAKK